MERLRQQYAVSAVPLARFFADHRDDGAWTA
jgi:hypothetical protein